MKEILIGNLRRTKAGVRCDRTSVLGNPFEMIIESERDAVCDAYRQHLNNVVVKKQDTIASIWSCSDQFNVLVSDKFDEHRAARDSMLAELKRLYYKAHSVQTTLLGWCAPKRCHCETIRNFLQWKGAAEVLSS